MSKKLLAFMLFIPFFLFAFIIVLGLKLFLFYQIPSTSVPPDKLTYWQIQSIDTMKYSRDLAREYLNKDQAAQIIDAQVAKIADTGANYVSVGTPYDEEFLPVLKLWVNSARTHNLNVWFRGNWSGWENWFDYETISPEELKTKTYDFILANPDLFADGDIFTACTECENGQLGDPRSTGKVAQYRSFLISLNNQTSTAFGKINKRVLTNLYSMNGDVARLVMDPQTTKALGGIVTIDHYVASPEQLNIDINSIAQSSGGQVMLGEVGVAIPDIHGKMTPEEKAQWLNDLLLLLSENPNIIGINYWVGVGGSTQLWAENLEDTPLSLILNKYYQPKVAGGLLVDKQGKAVKNVIVSNGRLETQTNTSGKFWFPLAGKQLLEFKKSGYSNKNVYIEEDYEKFTILLEKN